MTTREIIDGLMHEEIAPEALATYTLEQLGQARTLLVELQETVTAAVKAKMREARADGMTHLELARQSGYASIGAIQQIVRPDAREMRVEREKRARSRARDATHERNALQAKLTDEVMSAKGL